jgi:hypothetical protein
MIDINYFSSIFFIKGIKWFPNEKSLSIMLISGAFLPSHHVNCEPFFDVYFQVLNQLCAVILEPLRDRVVTGLLQASLVLLLDSFRNLSFIAIEICKIIFMYMQEGLLRVILDGGPTRIFFPNDSKLLEDDLEILKVPLCLYIEAYYFLFLLFRPR